MEVRSRDDIERILRSLPDGLTLQDSTGRLVWANEAAARACQATSVQELLATPVSEIFARFDLLDEQGAPFNVDRLPGRLALQGREAPETLICVKPRAGGTDRWSVVKAVPLHGPDGRVELVVNIWHDVTELRHAIRARDEFVAIASHELRSPLMAVQLLAELILQRTRSERGAPWLSERLEELVGQVQRLVALVDSLLDVNRLVEGRLELELIDVDAAAVGRQAMARYAAEAKKVGSTLSIRADNPVIGRWDALRIDQIVSNLVENAIRHGDGSPIQVTITGDGETARIVVSDGGKGIAPEDQRRIFQRFERAASSRHRGGLGLGLWIVSQIVEALRGTIGLESCPGKGATFVVTLPRR
jgi:signal transduction histidine kinase